MNANYLLEALNIAQQSADNQANRPLSASIRAGTPFSASTLPQSIIHGDATLYNCLFVGDQLSALLDWEEVTVGASLLDLAMSYTYVLFRQKSFPASTIDRFLGWLYADSTFNSRRNRSSLK